MTKYTNYNINANRFGTQYAAAQMPVEQTVASNDPFAGFEMKAIETAKDLGMLDANNVFQHIMESIELNIELFANDGWTVKTNPRKMIVDKKDTNLSIVTVRVSNKTLWRQSIVAETEDRKIEFLQKLHQFVMKGGLDKEIELFCQQRVEEQQAAKQRKKEKRKAENEAKKLAAKQMKLQAVANEKSHFRMAA